MVVTQVQYIVQKLEESNLSHLFEVHDYGGGGLSVNFTAGEEKKPFASVNMGIAEPGVIYHFTASPEEFADPKTNETVRGIVQQSFSVVENQEYEEISVETLF